MEVFQIRVRVALRENIPLEDMQTKITEYIDKVLGKDSEFSKIHLENRYKNYSFGGFYKSEPDKIYKKDQIYTITIRTIEPELAKYFGEKLKFGSSNSIAGISVEIKIIQQKYIDKIYSLSPAIIKDKGEYWKNHMSIDEWEKRIQINLIKKYNTVEGIKMDENFQLFTTIEFKNRIPIGTKFKDIVLLGDKIEATVDSNPNAQKLAYMALGTGILENNGRGFGFINFRYL